jgi:hypothetical protein
VQECIDLHDIVGGEGIEAAECLSPAPGFQGVWRQVEKSRFRRWRSYVSINSKIYGGKLDFTHGLIAQSSESSFYCIGGNSLQKICYALNILLL